MQAFAIVLVAIAIVVAALFISGTIGGDSVCVERLPGWCEATGQVN